MSGVDEVGEDEKTNQRREECREPFWRQPTPEADFTRPDRVTGADLAPAPELAFAVEAAPFDFEADFCAACGLGSLVAFVVRSLAALAETDGDFACPALVVVRSVAGALLFPTITAAGGTASNSKPNSAATSWSTSTRSLPAAASVIDRSAPAETSSLRFNSAQREQEVRIDGRAARRRRRAPPRRACTSPPSRGRSTTS